MSPRTAQNPHNPERAYGQQRRPRERLGLDDGMEGQGYARVAMVALHGQRGSGPRNFNIWEPIEIA
ncbi:MAG: hypothetical protein E4H37_08820 [Gemmatimonadales bacterium]|nr:MAG: hypothetical protein E4H37_08820 [Gemmatimonadales bacterium]